ncbi:MAG: protein phosphatase CheZ [Alphaproteobacteria bacterium]|nr:protein phosphatase CheZ [Alphaproteobacteria bacterium]MBV8548211.1 protein phosphatase CheZ [Alphaproteobacteria bacterium]
MADTERYTTLQNTLQDKIARAHEEVRKPLSSDEVAKIVRQVVESLEGDVSPADLRFYSELEELARYIRQAKHEIAAIKPKDISTNYIPSATDELDAVVGATEDATNKIMDVCDEMSAIAETCSQETKDQLIGCTTKIFEACNFQDITGQRITKVVETLKHIDARIEAIVKAMGEEMHRGDGSREVKHVHAADPDKGLLNGPQLPQNAVTQDDIDRLLGN